MIKASRLDNLPIEFRHPVSKLPTRGVGYLSFVLNQFSVVQHQNELASTAPIDYADRDKRFRHLNRELRSYWNQQHQGAPEGAAFGLPQHIPDTDTGMATRYCTSVFDFEYVLQKVCAHAIDLNFKNPSLALKEISSRVIVK